MKTLRERNRILLNFTMLLSFLFILNSSCTKQEKISNEEIEKTVLSLEKKALDSWSNGDPVSFYKNFAPDATYFDDVGAQMGLNSNAELKKYFKSLEGKIPAHTYELESPKVQVYDDIAILTLRYQATMDTIVASPWKATSVYRLINDEWKVVHANWSEVKE